MPLPRGSNTGELSSLVRLDIPPGNGRAQEKKGRKRPQKKKKKNLSSPPASSNVAPSTATKSVVHNAQFAAAYGGFHLFKPLEVMYQETSNAVMGILLVHDVRNKKSASSAQVGILIFKTSF